jgi:hypothetical protein
MGITTETLESPQPAMDSIAMTAMTENSLLMISSFSVTGVCSELPPAAAVIPA